MPYVRTRLGRWFYEERGAAKTEKDPAILLLHGMLFDGRMWKRQVDALAQHGRVIVIDGPGHGRSEAPPRFMLEDQADAMLDVFDELKFHVKFTIAELVVVAPTWAFVRTNSAGTTDHHSTGKTTAEANQELFIFKKEGDGKWRIARYSFSPTNPPAK